MKLNKKQINLLNVSYQTILTALALVIMALARFLPRLAPFNASASQVIYQFVAVLILWLFVAIDWPSLLLLAAFSTVPEIKMSAILQSAFGNQTFAFLLFTFSCTYALTKVGLLQKVAVAFISSSFAKRGGWHFVLAYFFSILVLGCFVSPTVLFFVYLALLTEICTLLGIEKGSSGANLLMLGTVFFCGISSGMTTISHVFPLIALSLAKNMLKISISHATYAMIAVPIGLISFLLALMLFRYILRPDLSALSAKHLVKIKEQLRNSEIETIDKTAVNITLVVSILVLAAWLLPDLLAAFSLPAHLSDLLKFVKQAGISFPPMIGLAVLLLIKVKGKAIITIQEVFTKGVSWPSLIMCAATLALGAVLTNKELAFNSTLASLLQSQLPGLSTLFIVFIFCAWAGLQTNFSSNMVTSTLVTSTFLSLTSSLPEINVAVLVSLIGMLASYAFAAPSAMPCVAIAAASGYSNSRDLLRYGLMLIILVVAFVSFIAYPLFAAVL